MNSIDKPFVKKSFNASAATYDLHASLQNSLAGKLLDFGHIDAQLVTAALDIGMGTGNLTMMLSERFPFARVYGCDIAEKMLLRARERGGALQPFCFYTAADAEQLPYKNCSFDLVASSFTYQWVENWKNAADEVKRILRPGGLFLFSVFGPGTFLELRHAYRAACIETGYTRGKALELPVTQEKIKQNMAAAGFTDICLTAENAVETYGSVIDLLRAIKGMGARNASSQRNRTPGVRKTWKRMIAMYEGTFGKCGLVPATYEIILGRGKKN